VQVVKADLDLDVARRIGISWRELRRGAAMGHVRERIYGDELEMGQSDALDVLVQSGPLRMGDLAEALRVDSSTATRAVSRLVDAGFAQRTRAPGDARGVVVSVTRKGRAAHDRFAARARRTLADIIAHLDDDEQERVAFGLERLIEAIDSYVADNGHDDRSAAR